MSEPEIEYDSVDPKDVGSMLDELAELYRDVFSGAPYYYGAEHVRLFRTRLDAQCERDGFALISARSQGRLVGYSFGFTMPPGGSWWTDLVTDLESGVDEEPPGRTFVLIELLVQEKWQGKGTAAQLHDRLLAGRSEERATLTARPDADVAQAAYARWGWQKVTQKRNPLPDSPIYDVLVKPLPSTSRPEPP